MLVSAALAFYIEVAVKRSPVFFARHVKVYIAYLHDLIIAAHVIFLNVDSVDCLSLAT